MSALPSMDLRVFYSDDPEATQRAAARRARREREARHDALMEEFHRDIARMKCEAHVQARVRAWREGQPLGASA